MKSIRITSQIRLGCSVLLMGVFWALLAAPARASVAAQLPFNFSSVPKDAELSEARVFDEPLVPLSDAGSPEENLALALALTAYSQRATYDDCSSLASFVDRYPQSRWAASLRLHLGVEYYNYGYFSKALDTWKLAWAQYGTNNYAPAKPQADRALGELARMYCRIGRVGELSGLMDSIHDRDLVGTGSQLIHTARGALWTMANKPDYAFGCGPSALDRILLNFAPAKAGNPILWDCKSGTNGFALNEVADISKKLGMNYQMAYRQAGAPLIIPSVIHWKVGHYAAVIERREERVLIQDYTFLSSLWVSEKAINEEASGYFLVPQGKLPGGWRKVTSDEGQTIRGKGQPPDGADPDDTSKHGKKKSDCNGNEVAAMTTYTFHLLLACLTLEDTPVGHDTPLGPKILFVADYHHLEANQPATFYYSNLGPKWTCNWINYITDNPSSPAGNVTMYVDGGGTAHYSNFNPATSNYQAEALSQSILFKTSGSTYELHESDGSRREFTMSDGATGSTRRIFLTQVIDPQGHVVQLQYDSMLRITNIVDAIGQGTTLLYTNTAFPFAITAVIDPFGRNAQFLYNASGALVQITDVLGMTSQYTYGTNQFIKALTTPYGTTTFAEAITNSATYLLATDPEGNSEGVVSDPEGYAETVKNPQPQSVPHALPASQVPHGLSTFNLFMDVRNSFYWDKKAYAEGGWDWTKSHIYHWLHQSPNGLVASSVLESEQDPLESRIWYNYPGQYTNLGAPYYLDGAYSGASDQPTVVARLLDDGTTQLSTYGYNAAGNMTNFTDPAGHNFSFVYASNNIDMLEMRMTHNGKNELLARTTFNSQHQRLTVTDASGQTTTYTYNSLGLIATATDPNNNVTTYNYDTNGYLLNLTAPLGASMSFTYDVWGRLHTVTDATGYIVTYTFDAVDRNTQVSYPDGTSEQYVYDRLDMVAARDRLGRWSTNTYDLTGKLLSVRDPLGRLTQLDWCKCGALTALTDPMGRTTMWTYDVQGRPVTRRYPDGSTVTYTYEKNTSRLHSRLDESGQLTVLEYNEDDTLKRLTFPNALTPTPSVSFTYDPDYRRILSMQDGAGTTVYNYNPVTTPPSLGAGELASVSGPLPNSLVSYQYDALGRVTNRSIAGVNFTIAYDALDRPITASNPLGLFHYNYADTSANLASVDYPNGQRTVFSYYDILGDQLLKSITNYKPGGAMLSSISYAHNPLLITAQTNQWDSLPARVWRYSYDAANQLTNAIISDGVSPLAVLNYFYDNAGNRIGVSSNSVATTATYNALNQLAAGGTAPASPQSLEWDAEKRLTAINQGTHRSEFSYDGASHRVRITEKDNGSVTGDNYMVWADAGIAEIRDATGANAVRRLFVQGEELSGGGSSTNYYYTTDHLGNIRDMCDAAGNVVSRYDYDPFGQRSILQQIVLPTVGFGGQYIHYPSGYNLTYFRGMDNANGRWLSRDPIGENGEPNLYEFMGNNPENLSDPLGLWFGWDDAIAMGLGAVAGVAGQAVSDLIHGKASSWADYAGAAVGGAVGAEISLYAGPAVGWAVGAGAAGALAGNVVKQSIKVFVTKEQCKWDIWSTVSDTAIGGAAPYFFNGYSTKNLVARAAQRLGPKSRITQGAKYLVQGAEDSKYFYRAATSPNPNSTMSRFLSLHQTPKAAGQMMLGAAYDSGLVQTSVASSIVGSVTDDLREKPCPCH